MIKKILFFLILTLPYGCKSDRDYIKNLYFSRQMQGDLEFNRNQLYNQSYVGVHGETTEEKIDEPQE